MNLNAKDLRTTLKILTGVIQEDKTSPYLSGVLFKKWQITGGNQLMTISLPFENDLPECVLDFDTLWKMSNSLDGNLTVKEVGKAMEFKGIGGRISVPILTNVTNLYPLIDKSEPHPEFILTYDEVAEVNRLIPFIDSKLDKFGGVFYNGRYFAATFGPVVGYYTKETVTNINIGVFPEIYRALLPIKADQFIFKNFNIKAIYEGKVVADISYVPLQYNSPDFDVYYKNTCAVKAEVKLFDIKKLMSLLTVSVDSKLNIADFTWMPISLIGKSNHIAENKESEGEIDINTEGLNESMNTSFNIRFLETCLNYLASENITFHLDAPNKPVYITSSDSDKKCLIMPFFNKQ